MRKVPLLLVLPLLLFLGCAPKAPLKIGFVGPLTGPSSAVGLGARNGFLLALGDRPGGATGADRKLSLVIKDDENDAAKCLTAFEELAAEGCRIVILATTSQAATAAVPWAMKEGILVLSPTVSNSLFSGVDDLFIRINTSSEAYGIKLADVAWQRYGKRRVAVVGDMGNGQYAKAVTSSFEEEFTRLGGVVPFVLGFQSREGMPAADLLEDLGKGRADGLLIVTASTEAALIAKHLEKAGMRIGLFMPPWPLTLDLIRNGGKSVEGAVAVSIADMEYRSDLGKAFRGNYLAEYGEEPSFTAMFGYEAASVLRKALASTRRTDPGSVKKAILALGKFQGMQGDILFDDKGDASRALFLFEIRNGRFELIRDR